MQKSISSKVCYSASPLEKPNLVSANSIGKMTKQKSASSKDLCKSNRRGSKMDQVSFGLKNSSKGSDNGSMQNQQSQRKNSLTAKKLMRGLTHFANE